MIRANKADGESLANAAASMKSITTCASEAIVAMPMVRGHGNIFARHTPSVSPSVATRTKTITESIGPRISPTPRAETAVDVADGYARNYLIPRGLAIPASSNELKRVSELREVEKRKEMREEEKAREDARKLKEQGVTIRAKAGETGRLYGSITSKDVADAIREELGVEIDRRKIELSDPIREIGTFTATVKLFAGVSAEVAINVVSAEGEE
jgi:large subunit ribosomal protein L9